MVVVRYKTIDKSDELSHHGIKGQKWGVKNGPPYPLDYEDHSSAEKRKNSKSVIGGEPEANKKKRSIDKELLKKVGKGVLITAGVVALGATAYSAIASGQFDDLIASGQAYFSSAAANAVNPKQLGKSIKQIDKEMVASINSEIANTKPGQVNCFHTTTSYILNSLFGQNTKALGYFGVDELSGMQLKDGRSIDLFKSIFDNISIDSVKNQSYDSVFSSLKPGSTGIIRVFSGANGGHFVNFEKNLAGVVTIVDPQKGYVIDSTAWASVAKSLGFAPQDVIDFSNATLKDGASEILKYIVK